LVSISQNTNLDYRFVRILVHTIFYGSITAGELGPAPTRPLDLEAIDKPDYP